MDEDNAWDDNGVKEAPIDISINNEIEDNESDDDFGDFEEGEFEEVKVLPEPTTIEPTSGGELIDVYNGDYESQKSKIDQLVNNIFLISPNTDNDDILDKANGDSITYKFDERAQKIFQRLISEDDEYIRAMIWKKSMIYKQLLLNLGIPEYSYTPKTTPRPINAQHSNTEFKNMYDLMNSLSLNSDFENLLKQVPDFNDLNIDKNSNEFLERINNSESTISNAKIKLESKGETEGEEDYLEALITVKMELLNLVAIWDEKMKDIKADNVLFSSYVENLIGNTQKKRRERRLVKSSKKK